MLKTIGARNSRKTGGRFVIVAAKYNAHYVDAMIRAAKRELVGAGATEIKVVRVPGSFEIPVVAAKLADRKLPRFAAILCFGVIFQGKTSHAQHVGWGVTHALAQIQLEHQIPVIHGVFLFKNEEQARVRCLGKRHNRGIEAARTALEMASVMRAI